MSNAGMHLTAVPVPDFLPRGPRPESKYDGESIRWLDRDDHYELIFTDDFVAPGGRQHSSGEMPGFPRRGSAVLTDIIQDMREGDHSREVWVFVGSFGGEVAALCMILQQLLRYPKRTGFNLGCACSCGWMLLFACQERYVSPFSQAMYHDIAAITGGKHTELRRNAEFMDRWQQELLKVTDTAKVLTPEELELGRTSEVWFTGRELIDRGAAKDYADFCRQPPAVPAEDVFRMGNQLVLKTPLGWVPLRPMTAAEAELSAESASGAEDGPAAEAEPAAETETVTRRRRKSGKPDGTAGI